VLLEELLPAACRRHPANLHLPGTTCLPAIATLPSSHCPPAPLPSCPTALLPLPSSHCPPPTALLPLPCSILVGLALGWLVSRLLRTPPEFRVHALVAIAFGNVGNLPLGGRGGRAGGLVEI
jgi:hypothetical protein